MTKIPPAPDGFEYRPFQIEGIKYILNHKGTLLADDPGLGKTIQAIGVHNSDKSIKNILVICPATLKINWKNEFKKWSVRPHRSYIISGRSAKGYPKMIRNRIIIINYEIVLAHRKWIDEQKWDLLVVDESQYLRNPKAQRTRAIVGGRKLKKQDKISPIRATRRLLMSGTPIINHPIDLWPTVMSLDRKGLGRSFVSFAYRYCRPRRTQWGMVYDGAANTEELSHLLSSRFMLRRRKEDVLSDLPPKRRQVIELPATGKNFEGLLKKELAAYEGYEAFERDGSPEQKREEAIKFEELSAHRHELALEKIPQVIDFVRDALENGPVVCFAHHQDVIEAISAAFKSVTITGKTSLINRQKAVEDFQAGKVDLFVGNIQAAGVGITLVRSQHVIFAELDWAPARISQAEDRCHRIGQTESILVQHLVMEKSIDARMIKGIIKKQAAISQIIDGQAAPKTRRRKKP